MMSNKSDFENQFDGAVRNAEDTEEMFWLRQSDDYQSKTALGNALSAQYRFSEAAEAFEDALRIKQDDASLYFRLGGAYLTIRNFKASYDAYMRCIELEGSDKFAAFPLGVWHYLKGDYIAAAEWFKKCLPCGDELAVAVIYWHCLCRFRSGNASELLSLYHNNMNVRHHTAYKMAVALFSGEIDIDSACDALGNMKSDLDYVVAAYGICIYLNFNGETAKSGTLLQSILLRKSVWPCISYLAAWNDAHCTSQDK